MNKSTFNPLSCSAVVGSSKPLIKFFLSYAHADDKLVKKLLEALNGELCNSLRYDFTIWKDTNIPLGADWHQTIQKALRDCDVGLLFVSTSFLSGLYITTQELPHFEDERKPIIPVALTVLDSKRIDLKGLESRQMFYLSRNGQLARCYASCRGEMANEFARQLATRIEEKVALSLKNSIEAHSPRIPAAVDMGLGESRFEALIAEFARRILSDAKSPKHVAQPEAELTNLVYLERSAPNATPIRTNAIDLLVDWVLSSDSSQFCAVLGENGMGKSTTLLLLAKELLRLRQVGSKVPTVLLIDFKRYNFTGDRTLRGILQAVIRDHPPSVGGDTCTPEMLIKAVHQFGALIIFDGIDEQFANVSQSVQNELIRQLWQVLPRDESRSKLGGRPGRMILSCRSHYFPTITELSSAITGEGREGADERDYTACRILPFREEQIRAYLAAALGVAKVEGALATIRSVHNLADLTTRPLLLSLIVPGLTELERLKQQGCDIQGITVYEVFVERWLARDSGKHLFAADHKRLMMQGLAGHLCAIGEKSLSWLKVSAWLDSFLAKYPTMSAHYKGKTPDALNQDFRAATLFLRPDNSSEYGFAHSSFYEYFLAYFLLQALEEDRPIDWDVPLPSDETLSFLGQLIIKRNKAISAWTKWLEDSTVPKRTRRAAFRAWLVARRYGWPQPAPVRAQLHGLDFDNWEIGFESGLPFDLRGSTFNGATIDSARLRNVLLTEVTALGTSARFAELETVDISGSTWEESDLTGGTWRNCMADGLNAKSANWHDCDVIGCSLDGASLPEEWTNEASVAPQDASIKEVDAGLVLAVRQGHGAVINGVAWSNDGATLLTASEDDTAKVWDAASGRLLLTLAGHTHAINGIACSPDGVHALTGSEDRTGKLWNLVTGKCLLTLVGHTKGINCVAWSPRGNKIFSGGDDRTAMIWDTATGNVLQMLAGHDMSIKALTWSPNGEVVATASEDGTVRIWNAINGSHLRTFSGHGGPVNSISWSPDGVHVATGSDDRLVKIWDATSGRCSMILPGHADVVNSIAWSPDGKFLATGSSENMLRVWDAVSGGCRTFEGHANRVWSVAWSPDGARVLSGSHDKTAKVWDFSSGRCLLTINGHSTGIWSAAWSPNGCQIVSGSEDTNVRIWDAISGRCRITLPGHANRVFCVAWSPDSRRVISGSHHPTVNVWDADSGECLLQLEGHRRGVTSAEWSPSGNHAATGSADHTIKIWNATGDCIQTLKEHSGDVRRVGWSADGSRLVSGSKDRTIKVWDTATWLCQRTLNGHTSGIMSVGWSPDGTHLVSGSEDTTVRVWSLFDGKCILKLEGHSNVVNSTAWSPNTKRIVSAGADHVVKIWDATVGTCLVSLEGHSSWVYSVTWSSDGKHVLSSSADGTMREWEAQTGRLLRTWVTNGDEFALVDFNKCCVLDCSSEAWRLLGWQGWDAVAARRRLFSAERYGALPLRPQN